MLSKQIHADLKEAMKARDEEKKNALRGLLSACTVELTNTNRTPQDILSDEEVIVVLRREVKRRTDAAEQYRAGGREDLATKEEKEKAILEKYLPVMMSRDQILPIAKAKKDTLAVADKSGMGKLIGAVMAELKGKADGADVKAVVESLFT